MPVSENHSSHQGPGSDGAKPSPDAKTLGATASIRWAGAFDKFMLSSSKTVAWREVGERTQDVLREYARLCAESADTAKELTVIEAGITKDGAWVQSEEWRISTYVDVRIEKKNKDGKDWFFVSVECDGQKFACECPSLARAHFFARWYRHLICYQFYSVGPNWADAAKK